MNRTKKRHYKPLKYWSPITEKKCYQLESGDEAFKLVFSMEEKRSFSQSIVDRGNMLVTGGTNGGYIGTNSETGEFINNKVGNNTAPRYSIQLPDTISYHAFVKVNQTTSLLIGGNHGLFILPWLSNRSRKTYYFNSYTNKWASGPMLKYGRSIHAAGILVDHATNKQHIAAVGGWKYSWEHFGMTNSVELLLHGDNGWSEGVF